MGFQLVISEGKEAGREFEFDQDSVVIGRTAECDVILYEAGVSRKHARILIEGGGIWIEDLGSSNGTRVNGETIKSKQSLKDGDSISMGPVSFSFKPMELEATAPGEEPAEEGGAHTRVVSISELKKSRNKGVAMMPKDASREQVAELGRRSTQMMPALKPRPSAPGTRRPSNPGQKSAKLAVREDEVAADEFGLVGHLSRFVSAIAVVWLIPYVPREDALVVCKDADDALHVCLKLRLVRRV